MVTVQVPQEHEARPVDGLPELAPNCEALISKLKRIEREPIRTPRLLSGGVLRSVSSHVIEVAYGDVLVQGEMVFFSSGLFSS